MADDGAAIDFSLIAAVDRNGLIGVVDDKGARLPWRLPADLAYFKRTTMGKPIVMGRRTFESIGAKPLPGRLNLVMTRRAGLAVPPGVVVAADLPAVASAVRAATAQQAFVIGGAEVFALFLPIARRLYLTEIDHAFEGNCHYPPFEPARLRAAGWREAGRDTQRSDEGWPYAFVVYERPPGGTGAPTASSM